MANLISPVYSGGETTRGATPRKMAPVSAPPDWGMVRTLNTLCRGGEYDLPDAHDWPIARKSCAILNKHMDRAWQVKGGTPCPAFVTVCYITKGLNPRKILRVVRTL